MFYSHQLLSRKAPLGQIWMAATMQRKLNRKVLSKINIVDICEQILNPSIPLALRLSGILMGGVVIVFNRKVKFLYEDVNRFLMEINAVWRNAATNNDPTLLPKGKTQAKYETVTLKNDEAIPEESFRYSMQLDNFELPETGGWDGPQTHQADPTNITLPDDFPLYQDDDDRYGVFDRMDVFGEGEGNMPSFTHPDHDFSPPDICATLQPTPDDPKVDGSQSPRAEEFQRNQESHLEKENNESRNGEKADVHVKDEGAPKRPRKRAKGRSYILDYDMTIISGQQYQSWLRDPSDILCSRRIDNSTKKRKMPTISRPFDKFSKLMEMPMVGVSYKDYWVSSEIFCPSSPLLELWRKCLHSPAKDTPERNTPPPSTPPPPPPGPFSPFQSLRRTPQNGPFIGMAFEDMDFDIGVMRAKQNGGVDGSSHSFPGNITNGSDRNSFSGPQEVSPDFLQRSASIEKGSWKRKTLSSAGSKQGSSLEKVVEDDEGSLGRDREFKLKRVSEDGPMEVDFEQLEETIPTQTPGKTPRIPALSVSRVTHVIASRLKEHFETPGTGQTESLNNLTYGMDRSNAAKLFYQICVMDSTGLVVAKQAQPYGDILISRGANM